MVTRLLKATPCNRGSASEDTRLCQEYLAELEPASDARMPMERMLIMPISAPGDFILLSGWNCGGPCTPGQTIMTPARRVRLSRWIGPPCYLKAKHTNWRCLQHCWDITRDVIMDTCGICMERNRYTCVIEPDSKL